MIYVCVLIFSLRSFIHIILDYCYIQQNKVCRIPFNSILEVGSKWNEIQLKYKGELDPYLEFHQKQDREEHSRKIM